MGTVHHRHEAVWKVRKTGETRKRQERKPVSDEEGQKKRWIKHFEELPKRPVPRDLPDITQANDDLQTDCDLSTKKDMYQAIILFRNGESAGPDSIPAEGIEKAHRNQCGAALSPLQEDLGRRISPIRMKGRLPHQAAEEGYLSSCSSYRGITPRCAPGKVFSRVQKDRMKDAVDPKLRDQ